MSSCSHRCSMMMMIVRRFDGRYLNLCNNFLEINIIVTLSCSYALFAIISCVYLTFTLGREVKSCKKWIFPSSFPVLMLIVDACLRRCVLIFSSFRVTVFDSLAFLSGLFMISTQISLPNDQQKICAVDTWHACEDSHLISQSRLLNLSGSSSLRCTWSEIR